MRARCIVFTGPGRVELSQFELRDPKENELLVETRFTCISPGTELRCLSGREFGTRFPIIPGYVVVGQVIQSRSPSVAEGTLIYHSGTDDTGPFARQWGGQVSHAVIPAHRAYLIPPGLDPLEATMCKLTAIAFHGVRLSQPRSKERVAVIGLGILGQLSARLHALSGAHVVACDVSPARVERASGHGFDAIVVHGSLKETYAPHFPDGVDLIVDVTGVPEVIAHAIEIAHEKPWDDTQVPGLRYLVQGSYAGSFSVPYHEAFTRELTLLVTRDIQPRDIRAVLKLMKAGDVKTRDLISAVRSPEDAPKAYAELQDRQTPLLTVALDWRL